MTVVKEWTATCGEPKTAMISGWNVLTYATVSSTNLVAAQLPAWTAVRADTQTAGRGRFQRAWISDAGGLWLSAVVPVAPRSAAARALPLVVGLAVCEALRRLGIHGLRMRWPNDVLVNDRKLAGLLIDQFIPGLAVAGIGINVRNQPEIHDTTLRHQTIRLADLLADAPPVDELAALLLRELRPAVDELAVSGFASLLPRVNPLWGWPRRVELDLDGVLRRGTFTGVDDLGRLRLEDEHGGQTLYEANEVRHLAEL